MSENQKPDLSALRKELPPFVTRTFPRFKELIGYSPRTIANMDCLGQGPEKRIMLGNVVTSCYLVFGNSHQNTTFQTKISNVR